MSTRACIVKFEKDVCKIAYIHYGADFISNYIYLDGMGEEFWNSVFDAAKEWDEYAEFENFYYQEITDAESIERLHSYDASFVDVDAAIFIFVEYRPENELYEITIRGDVSDEGEWWNDEWKEDEEGIDKIRKFVGVKSAKEQ